MPTIASRLLTQSAVAQAQAFVEPLGIGLWNVQALHPKDGATITAWPDYHRINLATGNATYRKAALTDLPGVEFNGSSDVMDSEILNAPSGNVGFALASLFIPGTATPSDLGLVVLGETSATRRQPSIVLHDSTTMRFRTGGSGESIDVTIPRAAETTLPILATMIYDPDAQTLIGSVLQLKKLTSRRSIIVTSDPVVLASAPDWDLSTITIGAAVNASEAVSGYGHATHLYDGLFSISALVTILRQLYSFQLSIADSLYILQIINSFFNGSDQSVRPFP